MGRKHRISKKESVFNDICHNKKENYKDRTKEYIKLLKNHLFEKFEEFKVISILNLLGKNMVLAGGSVLGLNDGFGYKDFDFFIIEENAQNAMNIIKNMYDKCISLIGDNSVEISQSSCAITVKFIRSNYCINQLIIQIILAHYSSIDALFDQFDLDCCCCAYDGENMYVSPRCAKLYNTVDMKRINTDYANRLYKYYLRGIPIQMQKYNINDIVNHCETGWHKLIYMIETKPSLNFKKKCSIYNKHVKRVKGVDFNTLPPLIDNFSYHFIMNEEEWYECYYPVVPTLYSLTKKNVVKPIDLISVNIDKFDIKYVQLIESKPQQVYKIRYQGHKLRLNGISMEYESNCPETYIKVNNSIKKYLYILVQIMQLNPEKHVYPEAEKNGIKAILNGIPISYINQLDAIYNNNYTPILGKNQLIVVDNLTYVKNISNHSICWKSAPNNVLDKKIHISILASETFDNL
jgi:hypothetical protein